MAPKPLRGTAAYSIDRLGGAGRGTTSAVVPTRHHGASCSLTKSNTRLASLPRQMHYPRCEACFFGSPSGSGRGGSMQRHVPYILMYLGGLGCRPRQAGGALHCSEWGLGRNHRKAGVHCIVRRHFGSQKHLFAPTNALRLKKPRYVTLAGPGTPRKAAACGSRASER